MIIDITRISVKPFELDSITEIKINQLLNEHATLYVKGIISKEKESSAVTDTNESTEVEVADRDTVLFKGLVQEIKASWEGEVYYLEVFAISFSIQADTYIKSRSFQDPGMDYSQIASKLCSEDGLTVAFETKALPIQNILLQYRETNWEYLKRLASHNNTVLIPNVKEKEFYFGVPKGKDKGSLEAYRFSVGKKIGRYRKHSGEGVSLSSEDVAEYLVSADDFVLDIADQISYQGKSLYVREVCIHLKGSMLSCNYVLGGEGDFKVPRKHNAWIPGLNLTGQVLEVNGYTVKVLLCVDESQDTGTAYAFPYITPYSAEAHTGFYIMPEKDDIVNILFPTEEESQAVALSSARQEDSDRTLDPDVKYFRTPKDKEIRISEKEILITAKTGGLYISMDEDEGINVFSVHGINVTTLANMTVTAGGQIAVSASGDIRMNAGGKFSLIAAKDVEMSAGKEFDVYSNKNCTLKTGEEMLFTSEKKMELETKKEWILKSEEDMSITSGKKYSLSSKEEMTQASDKELSISAKNKIGVSCKASSIKMDGSMHLKASTIKEN